MRNDFFKLAARQIWKNQLFSFVNFTGLALGLAFFFLTIIWYRFEHSYDGHYPLAERLYRLDFEVDFTGSSFTLTRTPAPFAPLLPNYFPQIEKVARLFHRSISLRATGTDHEFEAQDAMFADSATQELFAFETLYGDVSEALRTPFALVVTDRSALRFFGTEAALGQEVMLANKGPFRVAAVVRAQPENAHLQFDLLVPFRLKIVAGRDFDKSYGVDHLESFIVNEQAVKALGWGSPEAAIGQTVQCAGKNARVVGVVNDFNVESLRVGMQPLLLEVSPGRFTRFAIKIAPSDVDNTLSFIEKKWREHFPEKVFESSFLDQALADSYSEETRFGKLIGLFAGIAISLSCFGLFGMIVFVVQRRTKEIGIRKVLGASAAGITGLLAKDFLKLVLIAILVARPVSYYFMDKWLADFAYRIDLDWWLFAGAGLLAVAVAFLGGFPEHESCAGKPGEVVAERVTAMAVRNLGKCYSAKN